MKEHRLNQYSRGDGFSDKECRLNEYSRDGGVEGVLSQRIQSTISSFTVIGPIHFLLNPAYSHLHLFDKV